MSRFDEEPDADPHGECAAEIHRLQAQVEALTAQLDSYAMALNETKAERTMSDEPRYTVDQIADAACHAEVNDSKFESMCVYLGGIKGATA